MGKIMELQIKKKDYLKVPEGEEKNNLELSGFKDVAYYQDNASPKLKDGNKESSQRPTEEAEERTSPSTSERIIPMEMVDVVMNEIDEVDDGASISSDITYRSKRKRGIARIESSGDSYESGESAKTIKDAMKLHKERELELDESTRDKRLAKANRARKKKKEIREKDTREEEKEEIEEEEEYSKLYPFTELIRPELEDIDAVGLCVKGIKYLEEVDLERSRSKNLNGAVSGKMKNKLGNCRNVISALICRIQGAGDIALYRNQNKKLQSELAKVKEEKAQLNFEVEDLSCEVDELKDKVRKLMQALKIGDEKKGEQTSKEMSKSRKTTSKHHMDEDNGKIDTTWETDLPESPSRRADRWPALQQPLAAAVTMLQHEDDERIDRSCVGNRIDIVRSADNEEEMRLRLAEDSAKKEIEYMSGEYPPEIMHSTPSDEYIPGSHFMETQKYEYKPMIMGCTLPRPAPKKGKDIKNMSIERIEEQIKAWSSLKERKRGTVEKKIEGGEKKVERDNRKMKPRIVSDVRVPLEEARRWTEVVKKGKKGPKKGEGPGRVPATLIDSYATLPAPPGHPGKTNERDLAGIRQPNITWRKPPRTAAVTITTANSGTYASVVRKIREGISLRELGIEKSRVRTTITGGRLIEISGPNNEEKADMLANQIRAMLDNEVRVARPMMKKELRLIGFDDSVSQEEIARTLAQVGNCKAEDVKIGSIRVMRNGLCIAWAQCPIAAAIKITKDSKIRLGWTLARVERIRTRPIQCYKCWEYGHVRDRCTSRVDRSNACFRCGEKDHMATKCNAELQCIICKEKGRDDKHRLGSSKCVVKKAPLKRNLVAAGSKMEKKETSTLGKEKTNIPEEEQMDISNGP